MEEDDIIVALCIIIIVRAAQIIKRIQRRPRRWWIRSWIQRRQIHGVFEFEFYSKTALLSLAFSLHVFSLFPKMHLFADDVVIIFSITL
jgi:hypothetical protein